MQEKEYTAESVENTEEKDINEETVILDGESQDTASEMEEDTQETTSNPVMDAEAQIAQLQDKYLRQVAEFDNYRKRTKKEKAELILNGSEKAITALLPILDDMERALKNMDATTDVETLKEGVELIFQKLNKVLASQGLKKIETEDTDFDTDFHEAIALIPAPKEEDKGKIIDCVQTGYTLNDKVIRHAKVAVGQ